MYIEVLNENDNVPLSDEAVYYPSILEDSPAGSSVLQIRATDKDKDPDQKITYKITSGSPERFFSINSSTGKNIFINKVCCECLYFVAIADTVFVFGIIIVHIIL